MRIHRLEISNFRGIKSLEWTLPENQRLVTLIGPGDSGKSTVLEAIHWVLGDRWNLSVADTDFFKVESTQAISIRAVVTDVPVALLKETAFGLWQSGLGSDDTLHQDPEDDLTPCLIARLTVDETLEPRWTIERVDGESIIITGAQRRLFSTFKVDDRTDAQLRWTRTSALGRLSAADRGEREALAAASRAARDALADHKNSSLADLALRVQGQANKIGSGEFSAMKPGLDTSRSSMGAGLALYEDVVPLTSFGLGSRRLASLAIQQLYAGSRAIAVVDELESGLEPHRAVRLLNYLVADREYTQVIVTTHSTVLVEQAAIESLAVVQNDDGITTITSLAGATPRLQALRRTRPSSFLARKVVICEGKTEYGIARACVDAWDRERTEAGLSTSAGIGVALQDGAGGSEVAPRAEAMTGLGYLTAAFLDNDDRSVDAAVAQASATGVQIIRWEAGNNTEQQVCSLLNVRGLSSFLSLGAELRNSQDTVLQDLNSVDFTQPVSSLDVTNWLSDSWTIEEARTRISSAAIRFGWFKQVDAGERLGEWLLEHSARTPLSGTMQRLNALRLFVYGVEDEEADKTEEP